jgi:hypothetical protein
MKQTQNVLIIMGFENTNKNVWYTEWFGYFVLLDSATPDDLAKFIYNRGKGQSAQETSEEEILKVLESFDKWDWLKPLNHGKGESLKEFIPLMAKHLKQSLSPQPKEGEKITRLDDPRIKELTDHTKEFTNESESCNAGHFCKCGAISKDQCICDLKEEMIECDVCQGTGEMEDYSECTNCNGSGYVSLN